MIVLNTLFLYSFFIDLFGAPNRFFNIRTHEKSVYCTFCKGWVGSQSEYDDDVMIRRFRLIRIDPRYLITICIGDTHDRRGNIIYHQHMSQVATVEKIPGTPVLPIELRTIQNGLLLLGPCPYARNLIQSPAITEIDQKYLSVKYPRVGIVDRSSNVDEERKVSNKRNLKVYARKASSQVETPAKKSKIEHASDDAFAEFLRDQPSTSNSVYDEAIEMAIAARNRNITASTIDHCYFKKVIS